MTKFSSKQCQGTSILCILFHKNRTSSYNKLTPKLSYLVCKYESMIKQNVYHIHFLNFNTYTNIYSQKTQMNQSWDITIYQKELKDWCFLDTYLSILAPKTKIKILWDQNLLKEVDINILNQYTKSIFNHSILEKLNKQTINQC